MVECKECGIDCDSKTQSHWNDPLCKQGDGFGHKGYCCDCFDNHQGMPENLRTNPRPKKN